MRTACTLLCLVFIGCGRPEPGSDRAGAVETWSVSTEPHLTIDLAEGELPYLFSFIAAARILSDGRIVVGDRGNAVLRVFDRAGAFQHEFGRAGNGPGEFDWLRSVSEVAPGTLEVFDSGLMRMSRFGADGAHLSTRTFAISGGFPQQLVGRFSDGAHVLGWIAQGSMNQAGAAADTIALGRFGSDGQLLAVIDTNTSLIRFEMSPVPFSPQLHAFVLDDAIYVNNGMTSSMIVLDSTGTQMRQLDVPLPRADPSSAWSALEAELETRGDTEGLERLPLIPRDNPLPVIAGAFPDDRDRIWVKQYDPIADNFWLEGWMGPTGGTWWVIDTQGRLLATIDLPDRLMPLDVRGDEILGLVRDERGIERVALYCLLK